MVDGRLARGTTAYDESSFLALLRDGEGLMLLPDGLVVLRPGETAGVCSAAHSHNWSPRSERRMRSIPQRLDPLHRGCERATVSDRSHADAVAPGRVLSHASGIVFGEMRECDEPGGEWTARDTINDLLHDFPGPVIFGFPSGHTTGPCWTLPLGVACRL
jgi:hypothetical protein